MNDVLTPECAANVGFADPRLLTLPAGRALDVVIARILGWQWYRSKVTNVRVLLPASGIHSLSNSGLWRRLWEPVPAEADDHSIRDQSQSQNNNGVISFDFLREVPRFSTDGDHARQARETMRSKWQQEVNRFRFPLYWQFTDLLERGWRADIIERADTGDRQLGYGAVEETLELALCRAIVLYVAGQGSNP